MRSTRRVMDSILARARNAPDGLSDMIGMPLAGWVVLGAADKPAPFFGLELPAPVGQDKAPASQVKELHETVGTLGYWLIGLHSLADLAHHYLWKDNTLRRMLP